MTSPPRSRVVRRPHDVRDKEATAAGSYYEGRTFLAEPGTSTSQLFVGRAEGHSLTTPSSRSSRGHTDGARMTARESAWDGGPPDPPTAPLPEVDYWGNVSPNYFAPFD